MTTGACQVRLNSTAVLACLVLHEAMQALLPPAQAAAVNSVQGARE